MAYILYMHNNEAFYHHILVKIVEFLSKFTFEIESIHL